MTILFDMQVKLEQTVRQAIIAELKTPHLLRESLDVMEIVLGFLSSETSFVASETTSQFGLLLHIFHLFHDISCGHSHPLIKFCTFEEILDIIFKESNRCISLEF